MADNDIEAMDPISCRKLLQAQQTCNRQKTQTHCFHNKIWWLLVFWTFILTLVTGFLTMYVLFQRRSPLSYCSSCGRSLLRRLRYGELEGGYGEMEGDLDHCCPLSARESLTLMKAVNSGLIHNKEKHTGSRGVRSYPKSVLHMNLHMSDTKKTDDTGFLRAWVVTTPSIKPMAASGISFQRDNEGGIHVRFNRGGIDAALFRINLRATFILPPDASIKSFAFSLKITKMKDDVVDEVQRVITQNMSFASTVTLDTDKLVWLRDNNIIRVQVKPGTFEFISRSKHETFIELVEQT